MRIEKYDKIAIALHWLIAIAIIFQLGCGLWMVEAIQKQETRQIAYDFYQHHKSIGLTILILSIFRLFWRIVHKPPKMPSTMKKIEISLANIAHIVLYIFMILIPISGWLMTSTSSYSVATMFFGLFEWPTIALVAEIGNKEELNKFFNASHSIMSRLMILLLALHIIAALKHQFINKDNLINRILP